jgi:hypothetical protein
MRTKPTPRAAAALVAGLLTLGSSLALAGPTEDAKVLFNVGAQAYDKGDFATALQAFEQAYVLAPRPGILFSVAQAHRKQYYTGGRQLAHLRAAIAGYREYLAKVEQGGRRPDAAQALVELEAIAGKLDAGALAAAPPPPVVQATRLMVTSQTADATISLDRAKPREVPLVAEVTPGKHSVVIAAPGFFDEARDVDVAAGAVLPLDIPLREKPGQISLRTPDGAQVSIDGRVAATTPLARALDIPSGKHLLTVTKNGRRAFSQEIDVARGEARTIEVRLESTAQRSVSYGVIAAGAAGVVAGGVLAGFAAYHQHQAQVFDQNRLAGKIPPCTTADACSALLTGYRSDVQARDDFRRDAGVTLGAGALVGVVGLMIFAFDQPVVGAAATGRRDDAKPAAPAPRERPMELSAVPLLGPGLYGASLAGRF